MPVVVSSPALWSIPNLLEALGSATLVIVLLFFVLIQQRELRARVVRLFGHHHLATTTRLLDEAGNRISRYLLMQSLINGSFGLAIGVGLYLLGVPFALALGFFAGMLRFIPYVGAWVAALVPIMLSLAVFDGWTRPLLIIGLFIVTEVTVAFVLEPLLFSWSAGVSALALLVGAAFWTWLWGPIGLRALHALDRAPRRLRADGRRARVHRDPPERRLGREAVGHPLSAAAGRGRERGGGSDDERR